MVDSELIPEIKKPEKAEPKKKRERVKKEKKNIASTSRSTENDSVIDDKSGKDEAEKTKKKASYNRRKLRTKKSNLVTSDEVDHSIEFDINGVAIDLSNVTLQSSPKKINCCDSVNDGTKSVKKQRIKKSLITNNSESDLGRNMTENKRPRFRKPNQTDRPKNGERSATKSSSEKSKFNIYLEVDEVFRGLSSEQMLYGDLRINPKDFKVAYVNNPKKGEPDIIIESLHDRNGALEGDKVVIKLKDEKEWKPGNQKTAFVVYIIEKNHPRTAVGTLKVMADKNRSYASFHPRDSRIPRMRIPFCDCPPLFFDEAEKYENVLFLACITKWTDPKYAVGTIIEQVGICGDLITETKAILSENELDVTPFSDEMRQYFPETGEISAEEYEKRLDLRNECIFTIDPATAKDLDDAVSCTELPNGNYKIGVHISDVTYYLNESTPLDEIVASRATSTYLVQSVYHMLPKDLCMICSLLPGEDKLAFSVFWEITPEGKVISCKFSRTVINSCVQLAYEHAQDMIENPEKIFTEDELPKIHHGYTGQDLSKIVNILQKLAVILRGNRFASGALRIDQPKVYFTLDPETCLPLSYELFENKECHRLIEEFMLLANITVATRLRNDFPDIAFLRSHPAPSEYMMQSLKTMLEKVGIHLDISAAGGMQQSLWKYSGDDIFSQSRMMVLNLLCTKPMARAKYFCTANSNDAEDYWHYALSVPLYSHFTSPIRRYADIMVHRQLSASLGYRDKPTTSPELVQQIAANCNKKKYNAKKAGEQSIELFLIHYIAQNQPLTEKAVVVDVKDNSIDAIIISNGLVVRIYLNNLEENVQHKFICADEKLDEGKKIMNLVLLWPEKDGTPCVQQVIALFTIITVTLSKKEKILKLETKLVRPENDS